MENMYDFNSYVNYINEGLITTYNIDKTISDITDLLNSYNINFLINKKNNTFNVKLLNINKEPNIIDIIEIFLSSVFNLYGWFPSKMVMENLYGMLNTKKFDKNRLFLAIHNLLSFELTFESKFDFIVLNIPDKLYHLTIQQYENDILKNGLVPKSKSKLTLHDYDNRIYLCDNLLKCKHLIKNMNLYYSDEKFDILYNLKNSKKYYNKNTKWAIFEIDSKNAGIDKLYLDPNFSGGFYYLNNISPKSIKIIEKE